MFKRLLIAGLFLLFIPAAFAAHVGVIIDISEQRMTVSVDHHQKYSWAISTARPGYRTPRGDFHPTRMYREYYSQKYDLAPMPWSIFFYGGYAIHGTDDIAHLGTPASHGCVRLHPDNARKLFNLVKDAGMPQTDIHVRD